MRSNYKRLGDYIKEVNIRNKENIEENLLGVSVTKEFIPSVANTNGTDWKKYKIVKYGQFCYIPDTSRRGDKIGIALLLDREKALVSQAYTVFEIIDHNLLLPEYLILWFKRPEFDRYARFMSHGSVREIFDWEKMCNVMLPIPDIKKQSELVKVIKLVNNMKISLSKLNDNLVNILKSFTEILLKDNQEEVNILDIFNVEYGKSKISKKKKELYPVYGAGGITGYDNKYDYQHSQIIIGCRGTCGEITFTVEKSNITSNSLVFIPKDNNFSKAYYYSFLTLFNFKETITGSVQQQITIQSLEDRIMLLPRKINKNEEKLIEKVVEYLSLTANIVNHLEELQVLVNESITQR